MKIPNSPKDLNREEVRQTLWYFILENPITPAMMAKETGLGQLTIEQFLDPESPRQFGLSTLLTIHKYLRDKYKDRDAQISKDQDKA